MLSILRDVSASLAHAGVSTSAQVALSLGLLLLLGSLRSSLQSTTGSSTPHSRKLALTPASTLPILGNTVDLVKNGLRFHDWVTEQCMAAQGRPWIMKALGRPDVIVVSTLEAYEDVTKTQFENFIKGDYVRDVLKDVFGVGIFTLDGAKWAHSRRLSSQLFSMRQLRDSMTKSIEKHAQSLCSVFKDASAADTVASNKTLDLCKVLTQFTTEAFCEIAFGIEMDYLTSDKEHPLQVALDGATRAVTFRLFSPTWLWKLMRKLDIGLEGQLKQHVKALDAIVLDLIAQSIEHHAKHDDEGGNANPKSDLISLFLSQAAPKKDKDAAALAADGGGDGKELDQPDEKVTPESLKYMAMQFLLAGRETTAQTLSWFFLLLSQHPEVETKIRNELKQKSLTASSDTDGDGSASTAQRLVYLEAALKETVRLYPSAPITARDADKDTTLSDGTFIPAGTRVGLPAYAMARLPSVWGKDAAEFKPERWIDQDTGKLVHVSSFKFVPFLAGPRSCIGVNLAMLEMKIVLAHILSRFHVDVLPNQSVSYDMSITLPMNAPLLVRVRKA